MDTPAPKPPVRSLARDSEAYRFLMSEPDEGVYIFGDAIEDCNEAGVRLFGIPREKVIGCDFLDYAPEFQPDGTRSDVVGAQRFRAALGGETQWFRWHYLKAGGTISEGMVHVELVVLDGRRRLIVRSRDLLELERTEHAVAEIETRFQQILDHTPVVAYAKDHAGRYLFFNREFQRVAATPRERIFGHTDHDIFPPEVAESLRRNDQRVLEEKRPIEFEEAVTWGPEDRTYLSIKFPIQDSAGNAVAVGGISTDITARKRADEALRRAALAVSTAQGERIFEELARALAAVLDADVAFIALLGEERPAKLRTLALVANGQVVPNIEYPLEGTPCADVCGRDFLFIESGVAKRYPVDSMLPGLRVSGYAGYPLVDSAGRSLGLIVAMSRRPLRDPAFIESMTKIFATRATSEIERARTEAALRKSEASHRAIFESAEDAIFVHDFDTGMFVDVNPKACSNYGYTKEELMRASVEELSSGVAPYTTETAMRLIALAKSGETQHFEWHRRNKDGSLHWDEVVLKRAEIDGVPRILAFTREITDRKLAEEGLRQAQKMEALGHLTGGIAHDFNNILASIMGNIALAADREAASGDARLARYLENATAASRKARDLIRQMLTYSRGRRGEPRPVDLGALLTQSSQLLRSSLPATVELVMDIAEDAPPALVDPVQVEQVLLNLCINARDAMGAKGTIRAGVRKAGQLATECASCRHRFSGAFIELFVEDTGPGIDPEVAGRMFEPFFTTKEVGKGSGLGLATVHGIVHEHGGHLTVESTPGRGTRFRVFLPPLREGAAMGALSEAPQAPRPAKPRLRGRVLLVDDEESVSEVMSDFLSGWGLEVTAVRDGREALARLSADPRAFDLVLTDQTMPQLTGVQLARECARLRPDLPVILCTGFGGAIAPDQLAEAGIRKLLAKPVEPDELLRALSGCLGAGS